MQDFQFFLAVEDFLQPRPEFFLEDENQENKNYQYSYNKYNPQQDF